MEISKTPFADKRLQAVPAKASLAARTDPYFRSFDQNNADFYDYQEWAREFDAFVANRNLPDLSLVRLAHDHFGSFGTARYGINTPGLQMADNDYAVGLLVQKIAHSPYKDEHARVRHRGRCAGRPRSHGRSPQHRVRRRSRT